MVAGGNGADGRITTDRLPVSHQHDQLPLRRHLYGAESHRFRAACKPDRGHDGGPLQPVSHAITMQPHAEFSALQLLFRFTRKFIEIARRYQTQRPLLIDGMQGIRRQLAKNFAGIDAGQRVSTDRKYIAGLQRPSLKASQGVLEESTATAHDQLHLEAAGHCQTGQHMRNKKL
jgi:hypothetical protein